MDEKWSWKKKTKNFNIVLFRKGPVNKVAALKTWCSNLKSMSCERASAVSFTEAAHVPI